MKIPEKPSWDIGTSIHRSGKLVQDMATDIAIIGGGLTGLATAYMLSETGKKIVVIEKGWVGYGATGLTTAFLTQSIDTGLRDLIDMFGKDLTKLILRSHEEAIESVEKIVKDHNIECEFMRCSNFAYANDEKESEGLRDEEKAGKELGVPVEYKEDQALGFVNFGYLEWKNQAKFHPLKYLRSLVLLLKERGVEIFEESEVVDLSGKGPYVLSTKEAKVTAQAVIEATYGPLKRKLYFKKAFYDTYILELEIPGGEIPEGIYEDNMDPYHYFRVDRMGEKDRVILGGEDHRSDIPVDESKNYQALIDYSDEVFKGIPHGMVRKWKGPIIEPVDGLPYIGAHKDPNIFYATGFSGNGMTYSHIAARIIADLIIGNKNPYAHIYAAGRKQALKHILKKGRDYTSELAYGAVKNTFKYRKKEI